MELYRTTRREEIIKIFFGNSYSCINLNQIGQFFRERDTYRVIDELTDLSLKLDLPTDEEAEKECPTYTKLSGECDAWMAGAKWILEEIKKRNGL